MKSIKKYILSFALFAALVSSSGFFSAAHAAPNTLPGMPVYGGNSMLHQVALTFDDGPSSLYTPQILAVLQRYRVHATFFNIGQQAQANPALVKQVLADGNVIGNHSWDHPDLTKVTPTALQSELTRTSATLQQADGVRPTLVRPPYGATNASVQAQSALLGLQPILWNVDTQDWQRPGVDSIVNTALSTTRNGSIILMHDGGGDRSQTVAALPRIIQGLQQRGYQLVTVPQLLSATPVQR